MTELLKPALRLTFPVQPPMEIKGIGTWSNTGRELSYLAEAIVVSVDPSGRIQITFDGGRTRGKAGTSFFSSDPRIHHLVQEAKETTTAMWRMFR